ncbi:hypothetical protein AURDEDRAFT_64202, partial [Auricularia subglabra TFB-10046 SS5]
TKKRDLGARVAGLQAEIEELERQLGAGESAEQIVSRHIKLLHEYNEAKDACQVILGKVSGASPERARSAGVVQLATLKQTTVRQLHEDYGLAADD